MEPAREISLFVMELLLGPEPRQYGVQEWYRVTGGGWRVGANRTGRARPAAWTFGPSLAAFWTGLCPEPDAFPGEDPMAWLFATLPAISADSAFTSDL